MEEKVARIYGMLAEFDSDEAVVRAAREVHEAGYRSIEAYSPMPVEGLSEALGQPATKVPLATLLSGTFGAILGFGMCWYANVISYRWNVGGRPPNSWPAFIAITFELMVLCASLGAVIAMLAMNGLPRPYHPVFNSERFSRASKDRFFICIESKDPKYSGDQTRLLLEGLNPLSISEVAE
jgi:ActD protein